MARASSAEAATPRQTWDPERYGRDARFVSEYGFAVVDALAPTAGERILDLGCGDGALSALVRERGADVIGLDSSPEQVAAARARGIPPASATGRRFLTSPSSMPCSATLPSIGCGRPEG